MKISIYTKIFGDAIATAARFASPRSPLVALHCIKIESHGPSQSLTLSATDLDTGVVVNTASANIHEGGTVLIAAQLLQQLVKSLPTGEATLETLGEGRCVLTCGSSTFELSTMSVDDYPAQSTVEGTENSATISQPVLKGLISQATVAAAAMAAEARAVMTGVMVSLNLDRLTMCSTDGRRLAVVSEVVDIHGSGQLDAVIPATALTELAKVLSAKGGVVTVTTGARAARFNLPGYEFHCRLLEGRFPDYTKVVPVEFEGVATMEVSALLAAVRRLLPLAQEKRSPNLLRLRFTSDELILSANTPDLGSGEERVPCSMTGKEILIGFNGQYLAEGLSVLDPSAKCCIDLQTEVKSGILRLAGDQSFRYVLMPVKLRDAIEDAETSKAS